MKNTRSEYIKNLVEDKEKLSKKLEEGTRNVLQSVVSETISKEMRQILSEANDDYEVDEVDPEKTEDVDLTDTDAKGEGTDTDTDTDTTVDAGAEGTESGETDTADKDGAEETGEEEEVWDGIEQYKGEDGEYDLTSMDSNDVIKVLKVMHPTEDGVRVTKNGNGTITLNDDTTEKEYIIDLDGSLSGGSDESKPADGEDEKGEDLDFDVEVGSDDKTTDECGQNKGPVVTEGEVNLGYTTEYQKDTAMTTPPNNEPADKKNTYSMDGGVPTGTERPYGGKGDQKPFDKKVNEGDTCANGTVCGEEEKSIEEAMTSTENNPSVRGTSKTHANTNDKHITPRNGSEGGEKKKGTSENSYSGVQAEAIKRKANEIFLENRELKKVAEEIRLKLTEALVVNKSLGNIIKLINENATTTSEKKDITSRFNSVKTIEESDRLYQTINEELKRAGKRHGESTAVNNALNGQSLNESKKARLEETTIYQSDDLNQTIDFMERLNKIK